MQALISTTVYAINHALLEREQQMHAFRAVLVSPIALNSDSAKINIIIIHIY